VVIPPEECVQRRRPGTPPHATDMIGALPPWLKPAIVRMVAIHAAMVGGQPTEFPGVLGGLRRMRREACLRHGVHDTVAAWSRDHSTLRREGNV